MRTLIVGAMMCAVFGASALSQSDAPVRARDVVKEFDADKKAAQEKYGGKPIAVTGEVRRINRKQFGLDNMILDGEYIYNGLAVWLAQGVSAEKIKLGDTVTVACTFSKQNMQVESCRFR